MIAAFLGLRLYSVLGRKAEHEEEIVPTRFDPQDQQGRARQTMRQPSAPQSTPDNVAVLRSRTIPGVSAAAEQGLRQIAETDRHFDFHAFLQGARGAYGMVLEAFWKGEREHLKALCTSEIYNGFADAIAEREAAGEEVDNRLIRIEEAIVRKAALDGHMARITISFRADIAAITRNREGVVVAGSMDDAVESQDVWTFSRDIRADSPDWLLEETDAG